MKVWVVVSDSVIQGDPHGNIVGTYSNEALAIANKVSYQSKHLLAQTSIIECEVEPVEKMSAEERQQALERDGFFKTALIAYAANFYAHNHQIDPLQVIEKCSLLAEQTWAALLEYRSRQSGAKG